MSGSRRCGMPHGDILSFAPLLVMARAEAEEIVGIVKQAVYDVAERNLVAAG
ncbi:hypothetical protein [Paraburkholderia unamae]|uniref:hypothetical protein n=1 Tax=Paraburkholderia unamae TaxID=219649 RepID=UPI001CC4A7DF|nr:hypothetical protein [Paraburkholderia unamae]